jgi:hypothetical protein
LPLFFIGVFNSLPVRLRAPLTEKPRLVWGSTPLINNSHWSRAISAVGYVPETFTVNYYSTINQRADWDRLLDEQWSWCPRIIRLILVFLVFASIRYDFFSAGGYFIGVHSANRAAPIVSVKGDSKSRPFRAKAQTALGRFAAPAD